MTTKVALYINVIAIVVPPNGSMKSAVTVADPRLREKDYSGWKISPLIWVVETGCT